MRRSIISNKDSKFQTNKKQKTVQGLSDVFPSLQCQESLTETEAQVTDLARRERIALVESLFIS